MFCKGSEPTGAFPDLFSDMVNCADDSTGQPTFPEIVTRTIYEVRKHG